MRTTSSPAVSPASRVACRCASEKYAGTVMTARRTGAPSTAPARCLSVRRMTAEISGGMYSRSPSLTRRSLPMSRLIDFTVLSG
jgi:hypothetical protein